MTVDNRQEAARKNYDGRVRYKTTENPEMRDKND